MIDYRFLLCLIVAAVAVHIAASQDETTIKTTKPTKPPKVVTTRATKSTTVRTTAVRPTKVVTTRRPLNVSGPARPLTTKPWKIAMQNRTIVVTKVTTATSAAASQPTQSPVVVLVTSSKVEDHMASYKHGDAIQWTTMADVVQTTSNNSDRHHMQHKHPMGHQQHHSHQPHHHQQSTAQLPTVLLDVPTAPQLQHTEPPVVNHHHRVGLTTGSTVSQSQHSNHQQQHQQHREHHGSGGVGNSATTRPGQGKSAASLHDPASTHAKSNAAVAWTTSGFFNLGRCLTSAVSILSAVVVFRWL